MKRIIFALVIIGMFAAISCKKESDNTINKSTKASFLTFSISNQTSASIDTNNHKVIVTMPYFSRVDSLVPIFTISAGSTIKVVADVQVSGTTIHNFTSPIVYSITAEDGKTIKQWTVTVVVAEYVVVSTDFLSNGKIFVFNSDSTDLTAFSIGDTGRNKTWNFANLGTDETDTINFLEPATVNGNEYFPGSTFALKQGGMMIMYTPYIFGKTATDKAELTGFYINDTIHSNFTDNLTLIKFPCKYGTNFSDAGTVSINMNYVYNSFPVVLKIELTFNTTSVIDASGKLTIPSGTYNCLREYSIQTITQTVTIPLLGITLPYGGTTTSYTYNYICKEKGYHVMEVEVDATKNIQRIRHIKQ